MTLDEYAAKAAQAIPRHLYKYRSLSGDAKDRVRDLIVNQRLYFAGPSQMNDPFECKPHLMTNATAPQRRRHATELIKRQQGEGPRAERRRQVKGIRADPTYSLAMMESMRATLDALGIFSLSAKHDDLLMWPHYANNHCGLCVRFDTDVLLAAADLVPFPVLYREDRPVCDVILERTSEWLDKAALTKGKPWAYEEEWRIIRNRGARQVVQLTEPTIDGVLLGANISLADRTDVIRWVQEAGRPMAVAQARFHPSAYRLAIEEIA